LDDYRETSRIALGAVYCALGGIALFVFSFAFGMLTGIHSGWFTAIGMLAFVMAFVLGLLSLPWLVITRSSCGSFVAAVVALGISSPVMYCLYMVRENVQARKEYLKEVSGDINLQVLSESLTRYASVHDGCLPDPNTWCDALLAFDKTLSRENFVHPKAAEFGMKGICQFGLNRAVGEKQLAKLPRNQVLIFEADGIWNLNGGPELLRSRYREHNHITIILVDGTQIMYEFDMDGYKKFRKQGFGWTYSYEKLLW
jgi:hypothetical protein